MITETKHTPTPWEADGGIIFSQHEEIFIGIQCTENGIETANAEANAAFIVRACNNHEPLIEALELARGMVADFYTATATNALSRDQNRMRKKMTLEHIDAALDKVGAA